MQADFQMRSLVPADFPSAAAFWRDCKGVEMAEGDDEKSFAAYLERNPGLSRCAEIRGRIVGAMLCGHDGRRGLIYHLAVAREFRGQGIGKDLLNAGLAGLRERGISRVVVLVARDNPTGREFWLSQGFEEICEAIPLGANLL